MDSSSCEKKERGSGCVTCMATATSAKLPWKQLRAANGCNLFDLENSGVYDVWLQQKYLGNDFELLRRGNFV
jgi:hypothetical protein